MRKLLWFAVGFTAACVFGAYFYVPYLVTAAVIALLLSGLLFIGMHFYRPLRIGAAILLGIAVGLGWFALYDSLYLGNARLQDGQTANLTIVARDYSFDTAYGCGFDGEVTIDGKRYTVRGYLNTKETIVPGDLITGDFSFRLTTNGGGESPTYHQGKGIFLIVYQESESVEIAEEDSSSWRNLPAIWRNKLISIIETALPGDAAGFAKALLLGDRSDIDYETNTAFKSSGIMHIIAVSGLHVFILFGLIQLLTGRRRILTSIIGIPVVLFFAAVALMVSPFLRVKK